MNFIKKHITAIIVTIVCLILIILAAFAVYRMFYPSNAKSVCGDRAASISVTNDEINLVKESIEATDLVNSVTYYINDCSTTIKFFIDVKSDTKVKDAYEIGDVITKEFSADIIKAYEIDINLTQKEGNIKDYPAVGKKAKESEIIYWVLNKEVQSNEE